MSKYINILEEKIKEVFLELGYNKEIEIKNSDRPELSDYQCNNALQLAREYKKSPQIIAKEVLQSLEKKPYFKEYFENVSVDGPGFINFKLSKEFVAKQLDSIKDSEKVGFEPLKNPLTVIVDYAGMNVAKIMHVGHLRASIIGEAIVRLSRFMGNKTIGDAHLGDWGTPMGMVIAEIQERQPNLPYFDKNFKGEYPKESPVTVDELIEIYPTASKKRKEDEVYAEKCQDFTFRLQKKERGIYELWKKFREVSVEDFKRVENELNVDIDLWYGESDADDAVNFLIDDLKKKAFVVESQGAQVIMLDEYKLNENDIPPFMMIKSNGTIKYETTDLGTIYNRVKDFNPDKILYVVDQRQELHFIQVFGAADKTGICSKDKLEHLGFGTVNGKDGKPFKTRDGGVATLQSMIDLTYEEAKKTVETSSKNENLSKEEKEEIAKIVSLAAIKFADLSNYRMADYIFTPEKFTSFEGKTGPYILYTIVRIKSILNKIEKQKNDKIVIKNDYEKKLALKLLEFADVVNFAWKKRAPNFLCAYIYDLAQIYNSFYHSCNILNEENLEIKNSRLMISRITLKVFELFSELIGIKIPDRM